MLQSAAVKSEALSRIEALGLVPSIRTESATDAMYAVEAVHAAGINVVEITMTVPGAIDLIRNLVKRFGSEILVGAGTVTSVEIAKECADAGAGFIGAPIFDKKVVEFCKQSEVPSLPGAFTPTEIFTACKSGADAVKVYPCSAAGGPPYIAALKTVIPDAVLIPAGGVTLENITEYIRAGAIAAAVGTELIDVRSIREGNVALLTRRGRQFVYAVRSARSLV